MEKEVDKLLLFNTRTLWNSELGLRYCNLLVYLDFFGRENRLYSRKTKPYMFTFNLVNSVFVNAGNRGSVHNQLLKRLSIA